MGAERLLFMIIVAALCAPVASARDPFYEQVCLNEQTCYGFGSCFDLVAAAACLPRGCDQVISCRAEIGPDSAMCAFNATIDGRTCMVHFGAETQGPDNHVGAAVFVSNGSVVESPLENTWLSPGAEARLMVAGFDFGHVYAHAYRSDIKTEGPRGGLFGMLAPSDEHTWTEIGAAAGHHGGPGFGEDAVVAIELMDMMPEGCWLRSPSGAFPEAECPNFGQFYRLIPLA